ncbi:hypothetical protein HDU96_006871 [Phlyctochytrium bullatum]|nr:hypothetical protein HDU96_006871 [Phlyctochytrium bullatum]
MERNGKSSRLSVLKQATAPTTLTTLQSPNHTLLDMDIASSTSPQNASDATSPIPDLTEQYWDAVVAGDSVTLRSLLSSHYDGQGTLFETLRNGLTALHFASRKNDVDTLKILVEFCEGHHLYSLDKSGKIPIQHSTDMDVLRALAAKMGPPGGDLFDAAKSRNGTDVRLILSAATDPSALISQQKWMELDHCTKVTCTPLHVAAFFNIASMCKFFLEMGADIDCRDDQNNTPLLLATQNGSPLMSDRAMLDQFDTVRLLAEKGASVNSINNTNKTALLFSAAWGNWKLFQFLINRGANIQVPNDEGMTALHLATSYGHVDIVRVLLDRGADVNCSNNKNETPLILATSYHNPRNSIRHFRIIQMLVQRGANITAESVGGLTPLGNAVSWGHVDVVRFLLENGADIEKGESCGFTPLIMAARNGNLGVVQLLVDKGADIAVKSCYMTAREWALNNGNTAVAEFLATVEQRQSLVNS